MGGIDTFLQESRRLIGQEATDVSPGTSVADWLSIVRFCAALGDPNVLYKDPASGVASKYNSMIAPNTFVYAVRTPNSAGPHVTKDYGLVPFFVQGAAEWVDVIRVGDRLQSTIRIADVRETKLRDAPAAEVVSQVTYRNGYDGLIGTATGRVTLPAYDRRNGMILDRGIHRYSDAEVQAIESDIAAEPAPRGNRIRYWDDVAVGEELPQLVKGPVTLSDMMAWVIAEAKDIGLGSVVHNKLRSRYPGRVRTNPTTDWPYWDGDQEFEDILSSEDLGFRMPVTRGQQRFCLAGQACTHWMGDDGFLRYLEVNLPEHWCYGDTMWLNGIVTQKRVEQIGRETYYAADVRITGDNQFGQTVVAATSTVYLPRPGLAVSLPVPH